MGFEVIVNEKFLKIFSKASQEYANKSVMGIINDFEDGSWRYANFNEYIMDNIINTALSHSERENLVNNHYTSLRRAAQNVRLQKEGTIGEGSEIAEILLYGLMKEHFSALPVVPKIFYKQNSNDTVKGADSVHIVLEGTNQFSLWFGEAKFFNSIEDVRLDKVVASVGDMLRADKLKKENSIISNVSDINELEIDESLRLRIKEAISPRESIDNIKPLVNIPILLLHECPITRKSVVKNKAYIQSIVEECKDRSLKYFRKQVAKLSNSVFLYSEVKFYLILFPVPEKKKILNQFRDNIDFLRG